MIYILFSEFFIVTFVLSINEKGHIVCIQPKFENYITTVLNCTVRHLLFRSLHCGLMSLSLLSSTYLEHFPLH